MKRNIKRPACLFFGLFSVICILLLIFFRLFPDFAEWFARYPAGAVRIFLGAVSSLFPFSLFELSIIAFLFYLIFFVGFALWQGIRRSRKKAVSRRLSALFAVIPLTLLTVLDLFALTFGACYERRGVAEHMGLAVEQVDRESVFKTLEALSEIINRSAPHLLKNEDGESLCPMDLGELKQTVNDACSRFGEKNSFYQKTGFSAKRFLFSDWITYTHISGVFGFFTGEANINTNYPHFVICASMAHEASHARGIGAENECNFLAAVILMEADSAYLNYCGAAFLMDDFLAVCRRADPERTKEILNRTDPVYRKDQISYSEFFKPYRNSAASAVADKTNSAYLKTMGQKEGTLSYSRVIGLTCAYFIKKPLNET